LQVVEFLRSVWSKQPYTEGYVFLSFKDSTGWNDCPLDLSDVLRGSVTFPKAEDDAEWYFCPNVFSGPHRRKKLVLPSVWLYADLDEVDPVRGVDPVLPATAAWQTSRGRYQCLWQLTKPVPLKYHASLNRSLTYGTGADKGGWSVTKVLRIPGTKNFKRDVPEPVALLWSNKQIYRPSFVVSALKDLKAEDHQDLPKDFREPQESRAEILQRHKGTLSKRARTLLRARDTAGEDRSARLWELECLLIEAGMSPEEVLVVVRGTVWNKFRKQKREVEQLWREVMKAAQETGPQGVNGTKQLRTQVDRKAYSWQKFLATEFTQPFWAVDGVWSGDAHGLIAGEPKTYKSLISMDLLVSVASGKPFLGQYEIPATGPGLLIQEENTPGLVRDRLMKIAHAKELTGKLHVNGSRSVHFEVPATLPLTVVNNARINLNDVEDLEWISELIRENQAKLVVLDPLYMMAPGMDENSAAQVAPVLRNLLTLKQRHGCGLLLVHHYNKPREGEDRHAGNRISGSNAFYRWFESAIYLEKMKAFGQVRMSAEHRTQVSMDPMKLTFDLGKVGDLDYYADMEITKEAEESPRERLKKLVRRAGKPGVEVTTVLEEMGNGISRQHIHSLSQRVPEISRRKVKGQRAVKLVWKG
jgi:hypothetical protein